MKVLFYAHEKQPNRATMRMVMTKSERRDKERKTEGKKAKDKDVCVCVCVGGGYRLLVSTKCVLPGSGVVD